MAVHLWRQRELDEYTFVDGFDFNSRELKPVTWTELKSCESKQGAWLPPLSFHTLLLTRCHRAVCRNV